MAIPAIRRRQNEAGYFRVLGGYLECKDAICGQKNQSQAIRPNCWPEGMRIEIGLFRGIADEIDRIHAGAVTQDLEVQVRAGRTTGFAHEGHCLAFFHFVADDNEIF